MNLVTLENISKQFSERVLLDGVSLQINSGERIGLIGANGSGKTTFLRMIAGLESVDTGSLTVWGGVRLQFLGQATNLNDELTVLEQLFESSSPQIQLLRDYEAVSRQLLLQPTDPSLQTRLGNLSAEMDRTNGWAAEANAKAILTQLGVDNFDANVSTLSGGQRKRVDLARALIDPADLLILDEPTNHIDADTIAWLEQYLTAVPRALLIVTHDRYFLDRVVNRIIELDRRQLVSYPANYSQYIELRQQRNEKLVVEEEKQRQHLRRELDWLHRSPMARSTKQKARIQRVEALQTINYDKGDQKVVLSIAGRRLGKRVLEARGLSKSYGDLCLFDGLDFDLVSGDRIGIIGPNGVGKSTLLDILSGYTKADAGVVSWGETVALGYYDQRSRGLHAAMERNLRVIEFIHEEAALVQTAEGDRIAAAQMLEWFLFTRPQQRARLQSLSGGEKRRLYLLSILIHRPNVLILDEPTNDLDIQTLTVLESFLDAFRGSVVVVSHDRYFLDRTVNYLAVFENGRFESRYPSPYKPRQRKATVIKPITPPKAIATADKEEKLSVNKPQKLSYMEKRELAELDAKMEQLEAEETAVQAEMDESGSDYVKLGELTAVRERIHAELEEIMERWMELSERAG